MKRMRRWLFNLAAVVSLIVFICTAVLWAHSYFFIVACSLHWRQVTEIQVADGEVVIDVLLHVPEEPPKWVPWAYLTRERLTSSTEQQFLYLGNPPASQPTFGSKMASRTPPLDMFNLWVSSTDYRFLGFGMGKASDRRIMAQRLAQFKDQTATSITQQDGMHFTFVVHRLIFPLWFAMLVAGAVPSWWLRLYWVQRRRRVQGLCATCGYDLRATPDRCPECGTIPTSVKGATS